MLGFDALGRNALGQISQVFILTAVAGAFNETGISATFTITQPSSFGTFSLTGVAAPLMPILGGGLGSFTLSGNNLSFVTDFRRPLYRRGVSYWKGKS